MMNVTVPAGAQLASTSKSKSLGWEQHEIRIPVPSYGNTRQLKADRSLIEGPGEVYTKIGAPLFKASVKCEWEAAEASLNKNPELLRYSITGNGETALHLAASVKGSGHVEMFVKNLVDRMESAGLELVNDNSYTALCLAAASGNIETVRIMLNKTLDGGQVMPLCMAALFGNYEVLRYLYERSNNLRGDGWNSENRGWLLEKCVETDMFDVAQKIVRSYPQLRSGSVLGILARKPEAFYERKPNVIFDCIISISALIGLRTGTNEKESKAMQLLKIILEDIAKAPREEIYEMLIGSHNLDEQKSFQVLFIAAELGNMNFLVELIRQYPDLMLKTNDKNQTVFHIAVKKRHVGIYNLLHEIGAIKDLIIALKDDDGNNILHLAAKSTEKEQPVNVLGAPPLEMQRELLWFLEVKRMIPFIYREQKNKEGLTPHKLFTREHEELVKEGERWMKDAINYGVVVAALIATVTFAAAITIPGGYNQNNGIPIFYKKQSFILFLMADAVSLMLSSTSILIFLSIITSRFAEQDFLESLPQKLWVGISSLLFSVAAMMFAFSVSFFTLYQNEMQWIPNLILVLACMPVFLYMMLQYHLYTDVIRLTYDSKYLFRPRKQGLF